jgi:hypothetical protein
MLGGSLGLYDKLLEERFQLAKKTGEIDAKADPAMLARLADSVMFSLAVRSRAGESRAALEALADAGVAMICGTKPAGPGKSGRARPSRA